MLRSTPSPDRSASPATRRASPTVGWYPNSATASAARTTGDPSASEPASASSASASAGRVLAGHDPRGPVHVHRHGRQVEGRAGRIAGLDRLVRRRPEQPQGLVAGEPAGGRAGGQPQVADPSGARRRQLGRLLVAPLCLRRPAAREQQPGQPGGQLGRGRPALLVARRPGERRGDVVGDPVEPGAPGLVDVAGIGPAELRDGVPAPPLVGRPGPGPARRRQPAARRRTGGSSPARDTWSAHRAGRAAGCARRGGPGRRRPRRAARPWPATARAASTSNQDANTATPRSSARSSAGSRS